MKADICDNISIYIQKYEEEFEPYLPVFVKGVWALLASSNSNDPKYDQVCIFIFPFTPLPLSPSLPIPFFPSHKGREEEGRECQQQKKTNQKINTK